MQVYSFSDVDAKLPDGMTSSGIVNALPIEQKWFLQKDAGLFITHDAFTVIDIDRLRLALSGDDDLHTLVDVMNDLDAERAQ